MSCKPPVDYADPRSVEQLAEPLRSRVAQAIADAPTGGLILVSGRRSPYQQWLLRHERCPGHECDPAYPGHPRTALPGRSHHENRDATHCAADMGGRDMPWFRDHLHDYGLYLAVPGENWHVEPKGTPTARITPFGEHPHKPGQWVPFHAGDTDATIMSRGGLDNEIAEVQIRLMKRKLYAGPVDDDYGPDTQAAVQAFKRQIIAMQKATGQVPWPNADSGVGARTIDMLRWWTA